MRKYSLLLSTMVVLILLIVVGCSKDSSNESKEGEEKTPENKAEEGDKNGGEIIVAQQAAVQSFDPLRSLSGADYSYFYLVYDTLIDLDKEANAASNLVKEWEVTDDQTIVLNLQEGVQFHDGTSFDAEAVKWNLERANDEGSNTKDLANIESIDVLDPLTVQLNLSEPDASIILVLSDRPGTMISPAAYEKYGDDYHLNPVGTGPFKVTKHLSNQEVVYEKNEDYWKEQKPYLDKIVFKVISDPNAVMNALQAGEIQVTGVAGNTIEIFEKDPKFNVNLAEQLVYWVVHLNTSKAPLDQPKVREAIKYAIDKEAMNNAINFGYGKVASQAFPEGYIAYNENVKTEYNPEKAKELLQESGIINPEIDIVYFADIAGWDTAAEIVADQLKAIGFEVSLEPMEVNAALAKWFEGSSSTLIATWSGRNDPLQTLSNLYAEDGGTNIGKTTPTGMDELMNQARENYDPAERAKVFKEIVAAVDEYVYSVPLFFLPEVIVTSKEVQGYETHFIKKPDYSYLYLEK